MNGTLSPYLNYTETKLSLLDDSSFVLTLEKSDSSFNIEPYRVQLADIKEHLMEYGKMFKGDMATPGMVLTLARAYPNIKEYQAAANVILKGGNIAYPVIVGGAASVECVDNENERITVGALEKGFSKFMIDSRTRNVNFVHTTCQTGTVLPAFITEDGMILKSGVLNNYLYAIAEVYKGTPYTKGVEHAVDKGLLGSFSIGGRVPSVDRDVITKVENHNGINKSIREITDVEIFEITLCPRGVNPHTKFQVLKSLDVVKDKFQEGEPDKKPVVDVDLFGIFSVYNQMEGYPKLDMLGHIIVECVYKWACRGLDYYNTFNLYKLALLARALSRHVPDFNNGNYRPALYSAMNVIAKSGGDVRWFDADIKLGDNTTVSLGEYRRIAETFSPFFEEDDIQLRTFDSFFDALYDGVEGEKVEDLALNFQFLDKYDEELEMLDADKKHIEGTTAFRNMLKHLYIQMCMLREYLGEEDREYYAQNQSNYQSRMYVENLDRFVCSYVKNKWVRDFVNYMKNGWVNDRSGLAPVFVYSEGGLLPKWDAVSAAKHVKDNVPQLIVTSSYPQIFSISEENFRERHWGTNLNADRNAWSMDNQGGDNLLPHIDLPLFSGLDLDYKYCYTLENLDSTYKTYFIHSELK